MISASSLNGLNGVRHGFFTRLGGVSTGLYASLNCGLGSGDSRDNVVANRDLAMGRIDQPGSALVTVYQVHSANAVVVDGPWPKGGVPKADGMATRTPGLALGVLTADCAPVLLADGRAKVVGAAHAGWRGAKAGILEATVARMEEIGAKRGRIVAVMGPCIRQGSYEVGPEFRAAFLEENTANEGFFAPSSRAGHFLFDLPTYVYRRLDSIGLRRVQMLQIDSFREADRFYSHRRATLAGQSDCGRNLSAIVLGD